MTDKLERKKEYNKKYNKEYGKKNAYKRRVAWISEEQRLLRNEKMKLRSTPYKRVFTNGGGIWKCAICKSTWNDGIELHIHHKDQDRSNNEFENLVCLCEKCHFGNIHNKWLNETIPALIHAGIVSWKGVILVKKEEERNNE